MKVLHYSLSIFLFFTILTFACGQTSQKHNTENNTSSATVEIAQGGVLMQASDCRSCHHDIKKLVGPSYTDVAKKYEFTPGNLYKLSEIIIKGKKGFFGNITMPAHPNISRTDAEKMARYILSLDGEIEH